MYAYCGFILLTLMCFLSLQAITFSWPSFFFFFFFLLHSTTELRFDEHTHTNHFGIYTFSGISASGNHSKIYIFMVHSQYFISRALLLLLCIQIIYLTVSSFSSHYYIWYREYLNIYGSSIRPVLDPWEVLNIYLLDK